MLKSGRNNATPKIFGAGTVITINTVKKRETPMEARCVKENGVAVACVACILGRIGHYLSKAELPREKRMSNVGLELGANYSLATRCWESSHDGLIRMGLKIKFKTGDELHNPELVRVKFNSAKSNLMLLKGGENVKTEVLVWTHPSPEAGEEALAQSFAKVADKLLEMARRVAQHEINKAIMNHLAAKHGGYVKDALLIPSKDICIIGDLVKVRDSEDRMHFLVGGKSTETLQGAIDFAISSFEEKYGLAKPAGNDDGAGQGSAPKNQEGTGGRAANGTGKPRFDLREFVSNMLF
ncbi:MAG: hypothetical protein WCT52_05260 [Candidatus Micrarchaeia archaeon]